MGEKELRQKFMAALPDRLVGLEMAYEQLRLSNQDADHALEQFYRLSHNMAGAAALYGFEQISAPCRELECRLRTMMRNSGGLDGANGQEITRLLEAIRGVIKSLQQENSVRTG